MNYTATIEAFLGKLNQNITNRDDKFTYVLVGGPEMDGLTYFFIVPTRYVLGPHGINLPTIERLASNPQVLITKGHDPVEYNQAMVDIIDAVEYVDGSTLSKCYDSWFLGGTLPASVTGCAITFKEGKGPKPKPLKMSHWLSDTTQAFYNSGLKVSIFGGRFFQGAMAVISDHPRLPDEAIEGDVWCWAAEQMHAPCAMGVNALDALKKLEAKMSRIDDTPEYRDLITRLFQITSNDVPIPDGMDTKDFFYETLEGYTSRATAK